jgi:hypothetical protein
VTVDADLLMELADCGSPEKLLGVIFAKRQEWRPPVPIEDFAASVGIEQIKALETDGFEGALLTDADKTRGVILFNERSARQRKRFTIGHELGHFLIPTHRGNQQCTSKDMRESKRATERERREAEANRFSAGLLMPRHWFVREMNRLGDADVSHVRALAQLFDTSLEATANRYAELTDDRCAFVFSKDGVVRYARPSKQFPKLAVRAGDTLPVGASKVSTGQAVAWKELAGDVWLQDGFGRSGPPLLEQAVAQANGFQLTLLFLEPPEQDEDEEEAEPDWQPRFRR